MIYKVIRICASPIPTTSLTSLPATLSLTYPAPCYPQAYSCHRSFALALLPACIFPQVSTDLVYSNVISKTTTSKYDLFWKGTP